MGYINDFCKSEETKKINAQLKAMYNKWYETWKDGEENIKVEYYHPQLATCTDSYHERRIMMFGKEANSKETEWEWQKGYLKDDSWEDGSWYGYDGHIFSGKARNTFFLKTRKMIAGIKDYGNKYGFKEVPEDRCKLVSIVMSNLNKTSVGGKAADVKKLRKQLYQPFEFNGHLGTVYQHEINILKPNKIVMCCGKDYTRHIERDFGDEFNMDESRKRINTLSTTEDINSLPYSKVHTLSKEETYRLFWYEGQIEIIYTIHPSAHMTQEVRQKYEEGIKGFVGYEQ